MAGNWITDDRLNPYDLAEGRAPRGRARSSSTSGRPTKGDLAVGDTTTVRVPEPVEVTVVGIATFGQADSAGPLTYAAFTPGRGEPSCSCPTRARSTSIRVAAEPGVSQAELVRRIDPVLPDGVEALTGAELTAEMEDDRSRATSSGFFAASCWCSPASPSWWRRSASTTPSRSWWPSAPGSRRCCGRLGPSRGQVLRSVAVEALAGRRHGLGGRHRGRPGPGDRAAGPDGAIGLTSPASSLVLATGTVVTAVVVGVVVTLVASLAPAVRASRTAPLAALRDVAVDRSAVLVAAGRWPASVPPAPAWPWWCSAPGVTASCRSPAGAPCSRLVGVVMLGPVVARPAAGVLGAPQAARRGVTGTLARRNAMRNPRRTAGTASALMVGVAVVSLFTVVGRRSSSRSTTRSSSQFGGDLVITSALRRRAQPRPGRRRSATCPRWPRPRRWPTRPVRFDGDDTVATTFDPRRSTG